MFIYLAKTLNKKQMNLKLISKLFFIAIVAIFSSSCSGDDDSSDNQQLTCTEFTTPATVNGDDSYTILLAQRLTSGGFDGTVYTFQVGAVDSNCTTAVVMQLSIEVDNGISGTYPVVEFFDADLNEASGNWVVQNVANGTSQSAEEIASGSVTFTDNGNNNYAIDFSGTLLGGQQVTFSTTHTF